MTRIAIVWVVACVTAGCAGAHDTSLAPTTTSGDITARPVHASAPPMPLPTRVPSEEPGPVDPRVERDLELAADAAQQRDAEITKAIHVVIAHDPNLRPSARRIDIETRNRKVTLRGRVMSERDRAEIDAKSRSTPDVLEVDDQIEVR